MTKDFSNPKKLGFMRFIQIMFAFNVVATIALLVFVNKNEVTLKIEDIIDFLNLMFDAVSFWLIWKRKKAARYAVISFSVFNITIGTAFNIAGGVFNPITQIGASLIDIILVLYFYTSRRAKAILVQPMSSDLTDKDATEEETLYDLKNLAFWRDIIIYFCVFSVVGHWMEAGYCTLIKYGIIPGVYDPNSQIWSDWFYPFMVYGFGMAACVLIFFPVKTWLQKKLHNNTLPLILSFIFNALVCTLIEFAMGMMLNQPDANGVYPLWDYSNMFCNFMGQVCLLNAIGFGLVATLVTWVLFPLLEGFLRGLPRDAGNAVFIAIVVGFCILIFFYYINIVLPDGNVTVDSQGVGSSVGSSSTTSVTESASSTSQRPEFKIAIGPGDSSSSSAA